MRGQFQVLIKRTTQMAIKRNSLDEEIRRRNKDSFQTAALYWNRFANERAIEISKQLLNIALVMLPLTGSIALANKAIPEVDLMLLLLGWIALFISIVSGFINFWLETKYFVYLSNDSSTREEIWSDTTTPIRELNRKTDELGRTKSESSLIPLVIQASALLIGVLFIMKLVYGLFQPVQRNNYSDTSKPPHYYIYIR